MSRENAVKSRCIVKYITISAVVPPIRRDVMVECRICPAKRQLQQKCGAYSVMISLRTMSRMAECGTMM